MKKNVILLLFEFKSYGHIDFNFRLVSGANRSYLLVRMARKPTTLATDAGHGLTTRDC